MIKPKHFNQAIFRRFSLENYLKDPIAILQSIFILKTSLALQKSNPATMKWIIPLGLLAGVGLLYYLSTKEVQAIFDYDKTNERHYRLSDDVK